MPKSKSAEKRTRTDQKRAARNNYVKRTINTLSKDLRANPEKSEEILNELYSKLDKAAQKGVIHKRTAARRKARLAAYVNSTKE